MSEDSIEIVAFRDDENVNVLNFAPTSPKGGTKIGGVNAVNKADGRQSLSPKANAGAPSASTFGSPPSLAVSTTASSGKKHNIVTPPPAWAHPSTPTHARSPKSPDGIMSFRAIGSEMEDDDEIMAFRANSSDSDGADEAADSLAKSCNAQQEPATPAAAAVPEDCMSIESLRVLPTIMEVNTEDSTDNILSHEGTEYASISSDEDDSVEVLDDGSIFVPDKDRVEIEANVPKSKNGACQGPKKAVDLKVNVATDGRSQEIDDLNQMLEDLNRDPCESPFSPLVGENILFSPRFMHDAITPKQNASGVISPRQASTSPRGVLTPRQTKSPKGALSPRQSQDLSSPRPAPSPRHYDTPVSPGRLQEPTEFIASPRQRQDPPSLLLEVSEEIVNRRFSVKHAVAEANHLKEQLDEQMSRTQEFSNKVMAKREAESKRQADLERELQEVARRNKALQAEIKKLAVTKKELQEAKSDVEREEAELKQLREEHKAKCGALEQELILENKALRDDIEKLVATKKELAEAKFKAEKEDSELALMKTAYENQLRLLEAEKQRLGLAMEQATTETHETNELSKTVLKELDEHKASVEVDMNIVRELHDSRMKVLKDEKEKLQAATAKAEQETAETKGITAKILRELEEVTQREESQIASLRREYKMRMELLEKEKEKLANAIEEAANETTETKEMTRTVISELEEYKVKLEMDMQTEIKDLKQEIREMEESHEKTMEKLVEKSEALQAEITSEQKEVQGMVKDMEQSIESLHQQKQNMENELTLRIESVNQSTKESKQELQQELNKARYSKAKNRFDKLRDHARGSLKCATENLITYNVESFTQAAYEAITDSFSDDLLIKQAKAPTFHPPAKKTVKKCTKQGSTKISRTSSQSKIMSPRSQIKGIRQTSSLQMEGKVISPREILL